jgi:hypothetical protein
VAAVVLRAGREDTEEEETMKTEAEIRSAIREIDVDERYHYKTATLDENSVLALIQLGLETKAAALSWVLGERPPKPGPRRKVSR